jgi:SCY1-like protein 2
VINGGLVGDAQIKIMMMQLVEAVQFIHQNANIIHRNIEPTSIYMTSEGKWKICGFNFASHANYKPGVGQTMQTQEYNARSGIPTQPGLDYMGMRG